MESIFAQWMAAKHIGHGSVVEYMTHPRSSWLPRALHASLIAFISAWLVASFLVRTVLWAAATTLPPFIMHEPNGEFPFRTPWSATSIAFSMNRRSVFMLPPPSGGRPLCRGRTPL